MERQRPGEVAVLATLLKIYQSSRCKVISEIGDEKTRDLAVTGAEQAENRLASPQ